MKSGSYHNLWQYLHQSARERSFPLRVMFELTYRCNFGCKHCYVPYNYREKIELKTEEIYSILEQLVDIGCFYLGFTGGEPFIRDDIMDILWYAKKKGFQIIIYSNGSLINEQIARQLQRLRPNKVDITIPAMDQAAFERISGVAGSRDKVFESIDLLYKNGVNLGFKTCVLKDNQSQIQDIQAFVASLEAQHRLDDMLSPCLDGSREPYMYRGSLNKEEFTHDVNKSKFACQEHRSIDKGLRSNSNYLFRCGVGISQVAITPQGELKLCLMIDYPKYRIFNKDKKANLQDAWQSLKDFVSSIKIDENYECDNCNLQPYCKWCPARARLYKGNFTSCDPESRLRAVYIKQAAEKRISALSNT